MEKDYVCHMTVDPAKGKPSWEYKGRSYYFCCGGCQKKFSADPEKYLSGTPAPVAMDPSDKRKYICPMCPGVFSIGPSACSKCGMALEPEEFDPAVEEDTSEYDEMSRRLKVSLVFAVPFYACMLLGVSIHPYVQWALATIVVWGGGRPVYERGWQSLMSRHFNMFTLIALGTGMAYVFSAAAVLAPASFPQAFHAADGRIGLHFESAIMIIVLVLLGQVLEMRARRRTQDAIRSLLGLAPKTARRISDKGEDDVLVPIDEVRAGNHLRIRPGEALPVDGRILEGRTTVDESMVTGESIPVAKGPGDDLIGGTLNGTGMLVMEATRVGQDTVLARIIRMVGQAQRSRAPIQRLADYVAGYFVPIVVASSATAFGVWALWGPEPRLAYAIACAVSVMIVACPCALGLATPMSIMVGMGRGALEGVLIKNGEVLELLAGVDTLVVDKTGTLTEGVPALERLVCADGETEQDVLKVAAALERGSEHPLAGAMLAAARERGIRSDLEVENVHVRPGEGVCGRVAGKDAAIGNKHLLDSLNVSLEALGPSIRAMEEEGQTLVFIAQEGRLVCVAGFADAIKSTTQEAVDLLRSDGVQIIMLTGDTHSSARRVARTLGLERFEAGVRPQEKMDFVQELQKQGARVAMAGDGINDAPALAQADVGIAMGTGTDAAMETAGVTLVKGDLRAIARARSLSRATLRNIRQNLFFAFFYNALGVPLAAGALYPLVGWLLTPTFAGAAMSLSSVSVIANALRLKRVRL